MPRIRRAFEHYREERAHARAVKAFGQPPWREGMGRFMVLKTKALASWRLSLAEHTFDSIDFAIRLMRFTEVRCFAATSRPHYLFSCRRHGRARAMLDIRCFSPLLFMAATAGQDVDIYRFPQGDTPSG